MWKLPSEDVNQWKNDCVFVADLFKVLYIWLQYHLNRWNVHRHRKFTVRPKFLHQNIASTKKGEVSKTPNIFWWNLQKKSKLFFAKKVRHLNYFRGALTGISHTVQCLFKIQNSFFFKCLTSSKWLFGLKYKKTTKCNCLKKNSINFMMLFKVLRSMCWIMPLLMY